MPRIAALLNVLLVVFALALLTFGLLNAQVSCSRMMTLGCRQGVPGIFQEALGDILGVLYTLSGLSGLLLSYALRRG